MLPAEPPVLAAVPQVTHVLEDRCMAFDAALPQMIELRILGERRQQHL